LVRRRALVCFGDGRGATDAPLQIETRQTDRNVIPVICEIVQPVLLYWHPRDVC
jgi:hypothetical protein